MPYVYVADIRDSKHNGRVTSLEQRRDKLKNWLDRIRPSVTEAVINDYLFWELQSIIQHNEFLAESSSVLFTWIGSTYVNSSVLAVRRQLDTDEDSISLRRLLLNIAEEPKVLSREYYRTVGGRSADFTYDKQVGVGATVVSGAAVQSEIQSLIDASERLLHFADRTVAHYDKRGIKKALPKFEEITRCLGIMEGLVIRYQLLLKGVWQERLLPPLDDFQRLFRVPWIA